MTERIQAALSEIAEFSGQVVDSIYARDNLVISSMSVEAIVAVGGTLFMQAQDCVNGEQYSVPVQDMDPLEADRIAGYFLRWFNAKDRSEF